MWKTYIFPFNEKLYSDNLDFQTKDNNNGGTYFTSLNSFY